MVEIQQRSVEVKVLSLPVPKQVLLCKNYNKAAKTLALFAVHHLQKAENMKE